MQYVNNVIIHGIHIKKIVPKDGDMIKDSYTHFGLMIRSDDHVSLFDSVDGLIDVIMDFIVITISNFHMTKHNDVMLFGPDTNTKPWTTLPLKKCQNLEPRNKNEITSHERDNGDQSCNGSFGRDNGDQRAKNNQHLQQNDKIKARVMENVMVGTATKVSFALLITLVIIIPCLENGIGEFDNFLKNQTEEAYKIALDAYVSTPKDVTNELNLYHRKTAQLQGDKVAWRMDSTVMACSGIAPLRMDSWRSESGTSFAHDPLGAFKTSKYWKF
ncbi:putative pectate lyase 7, partial [Mucuna pruriens]